LTFKDFNFESSLLEGIQSMGYDKPTPIQEMAVPAILAGKDLIACAQTGTGKTAAYVLPIIQKILQSTDRHCNTLILAPTRELAQQIDQQVEAFGYFTGVSSMPVYGGGDGVTWEQQKKAIREGIDIVIATPGRLISHMSSGDLKMPHLEHLILDEADRMLDMGFYEDILRIISFLPKKRQTLLFSATMPSKIRALATRILDNPEQINIAISKPAEGIIQLYYKVNDENKLELISKILSGNTYKSILIFASTREKVKKLDTAMQKAGFECKAFHSDLLQGEREEIMRAFKNKLLPMLIGTDVLSRGIDVEGIDLVVNYDVPPDPEDYVHRIGRTARAERTGTAITFVNHHDIGKFKRIEEMIGKVINLVENPAGVPAASESAFQAHPQRNGRSSGGYKGKKNFKSNKPK
jgi:ATP-dependent RNA helicase RhlE